MYCSTKNDTPFITLSQFLADRTVAQCNRGYWHHNVVCPSVICPSVTQCIVALRVAVEG